MTEADPVHPQPASHPQPPDQPAPGGRPPLARRLQAKFMQAVNVPMRTLLGLPFPTPLGGRLMLARIVTPGGGRWKLNLRDGHPVTLRLRGRDVLARPELVSDPAEIGLEFLAGLTVPFPLRLEDCDCLDQRASWYPDPNVPEGTLMQWWLNIATVLGWLLSSIFALSLARLSRSS
ncbi:MAG TPA: hypothetical protein VG268_16365 [Streptosporangiaceae bacterium]|nr:hypothetical protein [Streptosporangiaceae bacterium]